MLKSLISILLVFLFPVNIKLSLSKWQYSHDLKFLNDNIFILDRVSLTQVSRVIYIDIFKNSKLTDNKEIFHDFSKRLNYVYFLILIFVELL